MRHKYCSRHVRSQAVRDITSRIRSEASSPASFVVPASHATQVLFETRGRGTGRDITSYQAQGIITWHRSCTRITCDTGIRDTLVRGTGRDITRRIRSEASSPASFVVPASHATQVLLKTRWFVSQSVTSHVVSGPPDPLHRSLCLEDKEHTHYLLVHSLRSSSYHNLCSVPMHRPLHRSLYLRTRNTCIVRDMFVRIARLGITRGAGLVESPAAFVVPGGHVHIDSTQHVHSHRSK